jgi:hypothetical protein
LKAFSEKWVYVAKRRRRWRNLPAALAHLRQAALNDLEALLKPPPDFLSKTTNATEKRIFASAISPDGKYLAYSDKTGAYLRLLSTGELHLSAPVQKSP